MDIIVNQLLFKKLESERLKARGVAASGRTGTQPGATYAGISIWHAVDASHAALAAVITALLAAIACTDLSVLPARASQWCARVLVCAAAVLAATSAWLALRSARRARLEQALRRDEDAKREQESQQVEALQLKLKVFMELQKDLATASFAAEHGLASYDPVAGNEAVERFASVKQNTQCIFARQSLVWGSANWDSRLSLEENVRRSVPMLIRGLKLGKHPQLMPRGKHLDGFLFEARGVHYGDTVEHFADTFNRVLSTLSDVDPGGAHVLAPSRRRAVGSSGWFFQFAGEPIFVTSFAPCYPDKHSRHQFSAPSDSCFIMLQPEFAFALSGLEPDHHKTNWDAPKTNRDRIRVGFRNAGREYWVPDSIFYPSSEHMVKSLDAVGPQEPSIVRWWQPPKVMTVDGTASKDDSDDDSPM